MAAFLKQEALQRHNPLDQWYENYCSGEQDAAIVAATMMYEAEEIGVHCVWLRGFDSQAVAETLNLPKNHIPVMLFAMGYASEKAKPSPWHFQRKTIEETVTYYKENESSNRFIENSGIFYSIEPGGPISVFGEIVDACEIEKKGGIVCNS